MNIVADPQVLLDFINNGQEVHFEFMEGDVIGGDAFV
jgi:hypothetical protein